MFSHFLSFYKLEKKHIFNIWQQIWFWGSLLWWKKKSHTIYWLLDSSFEMWFWYRLRYPSRLLANLGFGFGIRTKFGRTLPTAKSSMKKVSVKATYQKKFGFTMSNLSGIPSTKLTKTLKLVDFLRRKLLQSFQLKESYSKRRLDGNPLSCDCNLKWFIDFSHQVSSEKSVQLSAVCASPPSLADTPTESLWREHDMICGMYFKIL